jgi:hypothetical protein
MLLTLRRFSPEKKGKRKGKREEKGVREKKTGRRKMGQSPFYAMITVALFMK